jgi:hypothetical protein
VHVVIFGIAGISLVRDEYGCIIQKLVCVNSIKGSMTEENWCFLVKCFAFLKVIVLCNIFEFLNNVFGGFIFLDYKCRREPHILFSSQMINIRESFLMI